MTKDELEKAYFWEIMDFYGGGAKLENLLTLLSIVYDGGWDDGHVEGRHNNGRERDYD